MPEVRFLPGALVIGRDELVLCSVSKIERQGSIPWRPARWHRLAGADDRFISDMERVRFPSVLRDPCDGSNRSIESTDLRERPCGKDNWIARSAPTTHRSSSRGPSFLFFEVWLNLVRALGSGPRDWWFKSTHLDENARIAQQKSDGPTNRGSAVQIRLRVRTNIRL